MLGERELYEQLKEYSLKHMTVLDEEKKDG